MSDSPNEVVFSLSFDEIPALMGTEAFTVTCTNDGISANPFHLHVESNEPGNIHEGILANPFHLHVESNEPGNIHEGIPANPFHLHVESNEPGNIHEGILANPFHLHVESNEPGNIHEDTSGSIMQNFKADQNQSFQVSGQSSAYNQHNGMRKGCISNQPTLEENGKDFESGQSSTSNLHVGRTKCQKCLAKKEKEKIKRRKHNPPTGEEDGIKFKYLCFKCAETEIKNLLDQIYRRQEIVRSLKFSRACLDKGIKIGMEAQGKDKIDDLILPWVEPPDSKKLRDINSKLIEIRTNCCALKQVPGITESQIPVEWAQNLGDIRKDLEPMMSPLHQDVDELAKLVVENEDIDTKTLGKKLCSLRQRFNKDRVGPNQYDDEDDDDEPVEEFIKRLDDCKRTLDPSEFGGLNEELGTCAGWKIPGSLEPIARRIQKACNKTATWEDKPVLIMLCAAIKEMNEVRQPEQVSKAGLLKWGAAINRSNEIGFVLKPAKEHLKRIAYAYFGSKAGGEKLKTIDEELQTIEQNKLKLEAQRKEIKECVDAAQLFQGSFCLSDGMFD